ncbi:peptidoglycan-binding protein [Promicromonospora sp. NPDC060204]|uniref:peptidoglycan-binding domain-containing protein n=1 Tax=Promicromonospora sp. NPDC060204 TaxID=3347071 RepID=UPI0036517D0A
MKMRKRILVSLLAMSFVVLGGAGTAAYASPGSGVIDGNGDGPGDDWAGEGVLCDTNVEPTGCGYRNSNATGLWQAYLTANGYLSPSQIDCYFGTTTRNATIEYQKDHSSLDADGVVGPATFGVADNALVRSGAHDIILDGSVRTVVFGRNSEANGFGYSFPGGLVSLTSATYATRGSAC